MIQRCTNPNNRDYHLYGGRGITICKRWMKFKNFDKDMGEHHEGYQIDRIDNNKGYFKENCRWTTSKQNNRNRRDNRLITSFGKTQTLIEWSEEYNIHYKTLFSRIYKLEWSIERALITPVKKYKKINYNGDTSNGIY